VRRGAGRVVADLPVEFDGSDFEVDPDGGDVALRVRVVGEAQQQAGFAHAAVADEKQLEQIIVLRRRRHGRHGGRGSEEGREEGSGARGERTGAQQRHELKRKARECLRSDAQQRYTREDRRDDAEE